MSIISPKILQKMQIEWQEILNSGEGDSLKKIINIDGKTIKGNGNTKQKAVHIVSAWSDEDGICFGQEVVKEKSNEITAIPKLLESLEIRNQIITIDAMGTQTKIAEQIQKQNGYYVLELKGNQSDLHEDVKMYFSDNQFCEEIKKAGNYKKTIEKARRQIETREYYQTNDINWINSIGKWKGLTTIGMVQSTIKKSGKTSVERRVFISS